MSLPIVLMTGQLLTDAVWQPLLDAWADREVIVADNQSEDTIEEFAQRLLNNAPAKFVLVGHAMGGFVAFEVTSARWLLLIFPNFFESWFLLTAARHEFRLDQRWGRQVLLTIGAGLVLLKVMQEYAIHHQRWLDGFTAVEAVEYIWRLCTPF